MTKQNFFSDLSFRQRRRTIEAEQETTAPMIVTSLKDLREFKATEREAFGANKGDRLGESYRIDDLAKWAEREIILTEGRTSYFVVKDKNGRIVSGGWLCVMLDGAGLLEANLFSSFTVSDYLGKGLNMEIIEARLAKAKKEFGCQFATVENHADNPVGLVSKFKSGFILVGLTKDQRNKDLFELYKNLDDENDQTVGESKIKNRDKTQREWREISLSDLKTVKALLAESPKWVGVDIKNLDKPSDNDPSKWALVMEKIDDK